MGLPLKDAAARDTLRGAGATLAAERELEAERDAARALPLDAFFEGARGLRGSLLAVDGVRPPDFFCVTIPVL